MSSIPFLFGFFLIQPITNRLCNLREKTFAPFIRYLLTNTTHEIPNFICYLAVLIILLPSTSVEAEKMFSQLKIVKTKLFTQISQDFLNVLIRIRHDSNSFNKIKGTALDKWRIQSKKGSFKIETNFHLGIFLIKVCEIYLLYTIKKDIHG